MICLSLYIVGFPGFRNKHHFNPPQAVSMYLLVRQAIKYGLGESLSDQLLVAAVLLLFHQSVLIEMV